MTWHSMNELLDFLFITWGTDEEMYHTVNCNTEERNKGIIRVACWKLLG